MYPGTFPTGNCPSAAPSLARSFNTVLLPPTVHILEPSKAMPSAGPPVGKFATTFAPYHRCRASCAIEPTLGAHQLRLPSGLSALTHRWPPSINAETDANSNHAERGFLQFSHKHAKREFFCKTEAKSDIRSGS